MYLYIAYVYICTYICRYTAQHNIHTTYYVRTYSVQSAYSYTILILWKAHRVAKFITISPTYIYMWMHRCTFIRTYI